MTPLARAIVVVASALSVGVALARAGFDTGVPTYRAGDSQYETQAQLAFVCDPSIEQAVRVKLTTAMTEPINGDADVIESQLRLLTLAANYQMDEAGPPLVRLYRQSGVRQFAEIAACYRTDAAESFQRTLLADKRLRSTRARDRLLIALAERGDEAAADALTRRVVALDSPAVEMTDTSDLFDLLLTTRSRPLRDRIAALPQPTTVTAVRATMPLTTQTTATRPVALATRPTRSLNPPTFRPAAAAFERVTVDGQRLYGPARRALLANLDRALLEPAALMDVIAAAHGWEEADVQVALIVLGKCGTADDAGRLTALPLGVDNVYAGYDYIARLKVRTVALLRRRPTLRPAASEPTTVPTN